MHQGTVIKGFIYVYYAFRNSFLTVIIPLSNYISVLGTRSRTNTVSKNYLPCKWMPVFGGDPN